MRSVQQINVNEGVGNLRSNPGKWFALENVMFSPDQIVIGDNPTCLSNCLPNI